MASGCTNGVGSPPELVLAARTEPCPDREGRVAGEEAGASGTPALSSAPRVTHRGSQRLASAVDRSGDPGGALAPFMRPGGSS